jgi:hypothetical protein
MVVAPGPYEWSKYLSANETTSHMYTYKEDIDIDIDKDQWEFPDNVPLGFYFCFSLPCLA